LQHQGGRPLGSTVTLKTLLPDQQALLDDRLAASLAETAHHRNAASIADGLNWGTSVADAILAWRS
jgi:hypothetical protein